MPHSGIGDEVVDAGRYDNTTVVRRAIQFATVTIVATLPGNCLFADTMCHYGIGCNAQKTMRHGATVKIHSRAFIDCDRPRLNIMVPQLDELELY